MKKFSLLILGLALMLGGCNWQKDYRVGIINENGIKMISLSWVRRMVSTIEVGEQTELWVPTGFGWYKAGSILRLLDQEKKIDLAKEVFWYNFGFWPDKVVSEEDWAKSLDLVNRLRYNFGNENLILKEEKWDESLGDKVMPRDMADSLGLANNVKISIYNASGADGLANFLAKRLEWQGYMVILTEDSKEAVAGCVWQSGAEVVLDRVLKERLVGWGCQERHDRVVTKGEIEIIFGVEFVKMLKYSNYVRTL